MTSLSGTNITIDELMIKLKEPLPAIGGFMEIIWDVDEPTIIELSDVLGEDPEFIQGTESLSNEITKAVSAMKRRSKHPDAEDHAFNLMSVEEILEKLRCKCRAFQNKFGRKADIKLDSVYSDSSHTVTTLMRTDQLSFPKIGANCKEFTKVKDYAITFIDDLLQEAEEKVNIQPYTFSMETEVYYSEGQEIIKTPSEPSSEILSSDLVSWVSYLLIEDFTPKTGRLLILNIISNTWSLKKRWTYCIDFTAENSNTCADFYIYEVKWSLPTMSYPIPQATASVYFTIEVSRVKPTDCPVNVSFQFETERYKFTIDDDIQHELFLDNILKCKVEFYKARRM